MVPKGFFSCHYREIPDPSIWAFVLTNIFEPSTLIAHSDGHTPRYDEIVDFEKGVSLYESHHDYAEYSHSHDER